MDTEPKDALSTLMEEQPQKALVERKKLIRCQVTNKDSSTTTRMVELENFRLWEHLLTSKHGLTVSDPHLCLWTSEEEYQENINIYSRAGKVERVNRISVELFDGVYGFTNTIHRFVADEDTEKIIDIISSRIPKHLLESNDCEFEVVKGRAIELRHHTAIRPMILGLDT